MSGATNIYPQVDSFNPYNGGSVPPSNPYAADYAGVPVGDKVVSAPPPYGEHEDTSGLRADFESALNEVDQLRRRVRTLSENQCSPDHIEVTTAVKVFAFTAGVFYLLGKFY